MLIDLYQIDAFTDRVFKGNPAAVCPLESWLPDSVLLKIAQENNLAETAYFVPLDSGHFHLRWFTPRIEMDLCGHATLASAFVIFNELNHRDNQVHFETKSGLLTVQLKEGYLEMDLPSRPGVKAELPTIIQDSLTIQPLEVYKHRDYLLVYESEDQVRSLNPDQNKLNQINLDPGGIIVSAPGATVDFVSRFFTPQAPIFEDPVTGSAHCTLTPYWSKRLHKTSLKAQQISERTGDLNCQLDGDRVLISGKAKKYLSGKIEIDVE